MGMGERIKTVLSPTLTVDSGGTGFDEPTYTTGSGWSWDSSTGAVITPNINGKILKIVLNFGSSNADTSANLTIATRDTPTENVLALTAHSFVTDVTYYPKVLAVTNTAGALTVTTNTYTQYVVAGSLTIDCADATDNDTLIVKIYYR